MALEEVAIICFSVLSCFGIMAIAYFKSQERQEQIRSNGITQRQQMKMGMSGEYSTSPYGHQEWWVPLVVQLVPKLLENPEVMKMVSPLLEKALPSLVQGVIKKEV
jgi:hypothetical protein